MYSKMPTKRKISILFGFGWPSIIYCEYNVKMFTYWIYFLLPPHVAIEDQILNAQLFMGETAGHVGTKYICVRLVPDSRFLIRIPNPYPNTNTNQH